MTAHSPTAAIFDLFETLVTESSLAVPRAAAAGERLGIPPEAFRTAWKAARPQIVVGRLSLAEALSSISIAALGRADVARIQDICEERAAKKAAVVFGVRDDVLAMLEGVSAAGLAVAVISNCFAEDVRAWRGSPLARHIDVTLFSFDERLAKPEPEIYQRALYRLAVAPAGAIFVGDGGDDELAGAAAAGIPAFRATWFNPDPRAGSAAAVASLRSPREVLSLLSDARVYSQTDEQRRVL